MLAWALYRRAVCDCGGVHALGPGRGEDRDRECHRDSRHRIAALAEDVRKTYDELVERGVKFQAPPAVADWGSSAILMDPDGDQFVLSSR